MAEARNGAESRAPAVEMDAVSMNRRRVEWNKMPSFRRQQLRGYCSDLAGLGGFELGGLSVKFCVLALLPLPKRAHLPPSVADWQVSNGLIWA